MKAPLAFRTKQSTGIPYLAAAKIRVPGGCKRSLWETLVLWSGTEGEERWHRLAVARQRGCIKMAPEGEKKARQKRQRESVKKAPTSLHPH